MEELTELMQKIEEAMEMSRNKKLEIENMKNEPAVNDIQNNELMERINQKESDKKEFDEMTENALIDGQKKVLILTKKLDKEYQDIMIETFNKKRKNEIAVNRMIANEETDEKKEKIQKAYEKATKTIDENMRKAQEKYLTETKQLKDIESNIKKYAVELDIVDKIDAVTIEEETKQEPGEGQQGTGKRSNTQPGVGQQGTGKQELPPEEKGKLVSVRADKDGYVFVYEGKDGKQPIEEKHNKMNLFKRLAEKGKLIFHAKENGINIRTALSVDPNILNHLNDKEKEQYFEYISGLSDKCFSISYENSKAFYSRALAKVQEKLRLTEGKEPEKTEPEKKEKEPLVEHVDIDSEKAIMEAAEKTTQSKTEPERETE